MNGTRLWTLGAILLIVALVAGTWFIGMAPRLTEAAQANDERESVEQQNLVHEATLAVLQQQFDGVEVLQKELDEMQVALPGGLDLPELINEVNRVSGASGVVVTSLTLGIPTPYVPTADATQAGPQFAAAIAGIAPENLLIIPLDLAVSGTHGGVLAFVSSLQSGNRLVLVHDLALTSGAMSDDSPVDYTLSSQLFVLLDSSAAPLDSSGGTVDESQAAPTQ